MNEHLIWNELGNINSKMGNIDKAMESFQKAIEIESAFGLSFNNLGICYQMKEKYPEAILLYQKSLDLLINDKESALVWKRMGEAYASIGDYARSLDAYQNSNDLISKTAQDKQSDSSQRSGPRTVRTRLPLFLQVATSRDNAPLSKRQLELLRQT